MWISVIFSTLNFLNRPLVETERPTFATVLKALFWAILILLILFKLALHQIRLQYDKYGKIKELYSVSMVELGIICLIFDSIPLFLANFNESWFMCSFQFRCSSIHTPRNLAWGTLLITWLLSVIFKSLSSSLTFGLEKTIKLLFEILTDNLLHKNQLVRCLSPRLALWNNWEILRSKKKPVPSVNRMKTIEF